mmetsp:Transcript_56783/g.133702  ORF Transcript_56783/g.133702 Transcript_56783/m.133702 type:complete len:259 (+) Transcript_56783:107-883(+)
MPLCLRRVLPRVVERQRLRVLLHDSLHLHSVEDLSVVEDVPVHVPPHRLSPLLHVCLLLPRHPQRALQLSIPVLKIHHQLCPSLVDQLSEVLCLALDHLELVEGLPVLPLELLHLLDHGELLFVHYLGATSVPLPTSFYRPLRTFGGELILCLIDPRLALINAARDLLLQPPLVLERHGVLLQHGGLVRTFVGFELLKGFDAVGEGSRGTPDMSRRHRRHLVSHRPLPLRRRLGRRRHAPDGTGVAGRAANTVAGGAG